MSRNEAPAQDLLIALTEAWRRRDIEALTALFEDSPETTYLDAGEVDPWIGPPAIRRGLEARGTALDFRIDAPRPRSLAPDVASVFAVVEKRTGTPPMTERMRVTLVARRAAQGWKIVHYAEAPRAPLLELESYYEAIAADGLEAIPPRPWAPS
ncbi:MAG: nuclear transport factor 2 family protein [Alphaproteobacteria bacterium]|nr:nuclear transport factor 2 family protein [Alphaproteobacteria bacterium]